MISKFLGGKLSKLKIEAFSDIDCKQSLGKEFTAMFNPEKYTKNYAVEFQPQGGAGKSGSKLNYRKSKPQEFSFEFLIDGTGAVGDSGLSPGKKDVSDEIKNFFDTTYKYKGKIHRPPYLKLIWGNELSKCILQKASVNYTMFKPDGKPLRATINATFLENISEELRQAIDKPSSPDLTHKRPVKDGDHLMAMTYSIYETLDPVIQVAKANDLDNIRSLPSGVNVLFPPVEESEI